MTSLPDTESEQQRTPEAEGQPESRTRRAAAGDIFNGRGDPSFTMTFLREQPRK